MAVNLVQAAFRFYANDGTESTSTALAAQNTNIALAATDATTFLCRILIQETGGTQSLNLAPQWQFAKNGGAFANITTTSSSIKAVTTAVFADQSDTTSKLGGTGTFVTNNDSATHDGLTGGANNDVAASGNTETLCALQLVPADLTAGDVIHIQISNVNTITFFPQIVTTRTPYLPNPVTFDGTNDYAKRSAQLATVTDNGKATFAFVVRFTGSATDQNILTFCPATNYRFIIGREVTTNAIYILGKNAAGTGILDIKIGSLSTGTQYAVCGSFDLSNSANRSIYVNDVAQALTVTTYTNDSIDWTVANAAIGAFAADGTIKLNGDLTDVWFEMNRYTDFSVVANRRLFFNQNNYPVDKGASGETPFGTAPTIYQAGPTAVWQFNRGLGGVMALTGALTDGTALTIVNSLLAPPLPAAMQTLLAS